MKIKTKSEVNVETSGQSFAPAWPNMQTQTHKLAYGRDKHRHGRITLFETAGIFARKILKRAI